MIALEYLRPLALIADRYDSNDLDDEARRFWGKDLEHENQRDPKDIILYTSRGGATLLTLQDCFNARDALKAAKIGTLGRRNFW